MSFARKSALLFCLLAFLAVFCHSRDARAQATSFNVIQYRPSPFADRFFEVDGSSCQGWGKALFGIDLDFSKDSMSRTPRGGAKQKIVDNLLVFHFLASVGLTGWLSAGIELPFAPYEEYTSPVTLRSENKIGLGDLLFAIKLQALSREKYPIGLGFEPFITFPTDSGTSFIGNNSVTAGVKMILDKSFIEKIRISLNIGYLTRNKVIVLGTTIDDRLLFGLGTSWQFHQDWKLLVELHGSTVASNAFQDKTQTPLEAEVGVTYDIPRTGFKVALAGGVGIIKNNGAPLFRASSGITYQIGKKLKLGDNDSP